MNGDGHERWERDVAASALGALEEHEVKPFEEHLAGCANCRGELAKMRDVVGSLALAAPTVEPPGRLKDRVMADVRAEAPRQPTRRPRRTTRPRWLRSGVAVGGIAAVAALVLALALTGGGGTSARTYAGVVYAPGASASLRESSSGARLRVSHLPAPPARRIYEVWLKRAAPAPIPTRALFATTTGSIALPRNLAGVQAVLVTAEPRPYGSRKPTRAPIVVVRLAGVRAAQPQVIRLALACERRAAAFAASMNLRRAYGSDV
jgi:anti-sigma-K factor RskA